MQVPGAKRSEPIRALYEHGRAVLWANVSVGAIVVATLWGVVPSERLVGWYACLLLMCWARAWFQQRFHARPRAELEMEAWGRRFVVGSTISGVLWGSAALLFFAQGNLLAQGLLTFAIGGLAAAAAGTLSCHLPAFFGFFVPALSPLLLTALLQGSRYHYGMAAILAAYAVGMRRVALNNHRAYARALQLGVANTELLEALSASESELREANRSLERRVLDRTETLERQSEALRQAQRLEVAGRLAGNLAHDFNSLLTVVINNASQLQANAALQEPERLAAAETLEAGRRGAALIRQLLALSRRKRPEASTFSLNHLLEEWGEVLPRVLGEGVELELDLAAEEPFVTADPGYVEQALLNLVHGTPASARGVGRLRLGTSAEPGAAAVVLWVEHEAFEEEVPLPRSANPYLSFDVDARSRSVGLATVGAIAKQWGGEIAAEERGQLVRYCLQFPAKKAVEFPASGIKLDPTATSPRATVLVVDDEPTLRAVMRRALVQDGHRVLVAESGARALQLAADHPSDIDLLLTDVVMPGISGLELARRLSRQRPGLAVLYVSGFTFEEAVPPTDLARGVAYLPKPFDAAALTQKVRELLAAVRPAQINAVG